MNGNWRKFCLQDVIFHQSHFEPSMTTISTPTFPPTGPQTATAQPQPPEKSFLEFRNILAEQYQAWRELPEDERIRHQYLEKHGLSEIDLDNLSAQDRVAHEEKIASLNKVPVFAKPPFAGTKAGDALTRAVVTLQSVLETPGPEAEIASERTAPTGRN